MLQSKNKHKWKPMRKVSKKMSSQLSRYSKLRKKYLEEFPICEICKEKQATDIHHVKGRSGELLNQTLWWRAACRECHEMIHSNPKWAMEHGYIISRFEK